MNLLSPESIVSILCAVEVGERQPLLRVPRSYLTAPVEYAVYLCDRASNERAKDDDIVPGTNWLVAMTSSHTAMADFILNPDRHLFTRGRWYQDFLRSVVDEDKDEGGVCGDQIDERAWCDLRQTCRYTRDAIDGAGLNNAYFCLSFEDWVELQLILVHAKFAATQYDDDGDYNCFYIQNPDDDICKGALTMMENMLHLAVLKSIQDHPSLEVRESATQRFLENTNTVRATLMMSGIIMGSTEGCESVPRVMTLLNWNVCTNCYTPIEITSLGRPDKRGKKCCSQPTCINVTYDYEHK